MTKKRKPSSVDQPTLFDHIKEASRLQTGTIPRGRLDITSEFKEALADDLRHACDEHGKELSRAQVAARMTDYLGEEKEVTLSTLNNWTAPSHPHSIPADHMPAWIYATNGRRAAETISRHSGLFLLPGPEAIRAEMSKRDEIIDQARAEKREFKTLLRELERRRDNQ